MRPFLTLMMRREAVSCCSSFALEKPQLHLFISLSHVKKNVVSTKISAKIGKNRKNHLGPGKS
jgi:hypothetical protein